jgi:hypothetical protein
MPRRRYWQADDSLDADPIYTALIRRGRDDDFDGMDWAESVREWTLRIRATVLADSPWEIGPDEVMAMCLRVWGRSSPRLFKMCANGDWYSAFAATCHGTDCPLSEVAVYMSEANGHTVHKGQVSKLLARGCRKLELEPDGLRDHFIKALGLRANLGRYRVQTRR